MFPDIVFELASQWDQPLSLGITLPDGRYFDLYGAEMAGLVNSPPLVLIEDSGTAQHHSLGAFPSWIRPPLPAEYFDEN